MSTKITVICADFVSAVHGPKQLEQMKLAEIAFVGRSNVGKSSLVNALCNKKNLAISSKTPGRTQALNYFKIRLRLGDEKEEQALHFVDLPGYGFSKASKEIKKLWAGLIEPYLYEHRQLKLLVLLIDIRRGIEEDDLFFIRSGLFGANASCKLLIAFSKIDKLSKSELASLKFEHKKKLSDFSESLVYVSSSKKLGLVEFWQKALSCL